MIEEYQLRQKQSLPLHAKEVLSTNAIRDWHTHWQGNVFVAFSGGKDSTVLLHLVRKVYPDASGVFLDTGLEYPEVRSFVKSVENVVWIKPKMNFKEVIEKYGYPVVSKEVSDKIHDIKTSKSEKLRSKRLFGDAKGNGKLSLKWRFLLDAPFTISAHCCDVLKKYPSHKYERHSNQKPIFGTMAGESRLRMFNYLRRGCNAFDVRRPISTPLAFWTDLDVWEYIRKYDLSYSEIYDKGYNHTGCMFCLFGIQHEDEPNRLQRMQQTHPVQYKYCLDKLGLREVLEYIDVPYEGE